VFGLSRAARILRRLLNHARTDEELDQEVRSFFELSVEREMANGLSHDEAQRTVRMRFDGPEQVKHTVRESWTGTHIQTIVRDFLYAGRVLRKKPGYAITAIAMLALGIGANAVIFSVVSGVLLRPLPFSHPDRLVQVEESDPRNGRTAVSYLDLQDWRREQDSPFQGTIAYGNVSKDLQSTGEPERVSAVWAERGLFRMLGVKPILGRTFREDDPLNVVILSASLWKGRFGGNRSCVGSKAILNGEPFTIIGVMPEEFQFPYRSSRTLLWIPWEVPSQYLQNRNYRVDFVLGRLKDNVSLDAAQNNLDIVSKSLAAEHPETNRGRRALVTPLSEVVTGSIRPALLTLLGAVGMVLIIACANVMNLLLARLAGRRHEIAIRSAFGAGRGRLIQQLLTESIVVSAAGSAVGLLIALAGLPLILRIASARIPRSWDIGLDWRVFCFLGLVSVGVAIAFGLAPALSLSKCGVQSGLKEAQGSRSVGYGSSRWTGRRLRYGLVTAEIAMAFILLTGAGVLLKAFLQLQSTPTGLVTDRVLTLHMSVNLREYSAPGSYGRYLHQLEERITRIPGVRAAGFVQYLPLQNWGWTGFFSIDGHTRQGTREEPRAELRYVSPGYFQAFRIPLRGGRVFDKRDTSDSPPVILINEALSHRYFPNKNPIGRHTSRGTIIGVVGDVRQSGLDHPATPEIYYAFAQNTAATSHAGVALVVSALGLPEALVPTIRKVIHEVNPHQALFDIKPMDKIVAESIADVNLYLWLIGLFGGLALALAIAGIYGVISYTVAARTQEFGIRLALGANRLRLLRLVLRHASLLVASGVALGAAGAVLLTRALKSFVHSVTPLDPALLILLSLSLSAIALIACIAPACRAARVDPNVALRCE
jgi:predicted permease